MNVCNLEIGVFLRRKIRLTQFSFEKRNRRTWFDLYVSGSVYYLIHMHILLYYVCHYTVYCYGMLLNWKILKGKNIKYINWSKLNTSITFKYVQCTGMFIGVNIFPKLKLKQWMYFPKLVFRFFLPFLELIIL